MSYVGRMVGFGILMAAVWALASDGVLAQKKKKDADPDPKNSAASEADYAKLKDNLYTVKITAFEPGKSISVRHEYTKKEDNPNYKPPVTDPKQPGYNAAAANLQKKYNDLQAQYQRAVTSKNAAQIQARITQDMAAIQAQQAKLDKDPNNQRKIDVKYSTDYDFDMAKKVLYRKMFLPDTDSEGNPIKYSPSERIDLEGDKTLPGRYISKVEEVQVGQEAKLFFILPKKKTKTTDETTTAEHPTVKTIIITKQVQADADTPKKK